MAVIALFALTASLTPPPAMLPSRFDLAEIERPAIRPAGAGTRHKRYRLAAPRVTGSWDGDEEDGIRVQWRWNRVKLRVPIPSI